MHTLGWSPVAGPFNNTHLQFGVEDGEEMSIPCMQCLEASGILQEGMQSLPRAGRDQRCRQSRRSRSLSTCCGCWCRVFRETDCSNDRHKLGIGNAFRIKRVESAHHRLEGRKFFGNEAGKVWQVKGPWTRSGPESHKGRVCDLLQINNHPLRVRPNLPPVKS